MRPTKLLRSMRALVHRRRAERELRDELEFHMEMQARKHMDAGMGPAEAHQRARAEFGSVELAKEDSRDVRYLRLFEELGQDVRYALRGFRRAPTFAITVVVTIALALGLNTAVFSIFNAYVLRPLEVRDPDALYDFGWSDRTGGYHRAGWAEYVDLKEHVRVFSDAAAHRFIFARVDGKPSFGELVSGNYFQMLGVGAALGRTLVPEDAAAPNAGAVVVLSHTAWKARYGGDSGIVGRQLNIRGASLLVVGVAREGFGGLEEVPRDFWVPVSMTTVLDNTADLFGARQPELLGVVVRLAPGVQPEQTARPLFAWASAISASRPEAQRAKTVTLASRRTAIAYSPEALAVIAPIVVAFALVLVIACANVANMMLARGMARQREIGIRLSLGAARSRLVRQFLTESVLLALPAALLGFVIAWATLDSGTRMMFATIPASFAAYIRTVPLEPDARVFAFILVASVVTALLFGLAPALQATRASVVQAAKGNFDAELRPSRLRNVLVLGQVTAAAMLLICSSILLRNSHRLEGIEPGVRTHDVLQADIIGTSRERVLARLRAFPGVDAVAGVSRSPLDGSFNSVPISAGAGRPVVGGYFDFVSANYFPVMGIAMVAGRNFTMEEETAAAPVTIVSESTARLLWPEGSPVGQTITLEGDPFFQRAGERALAHRATVIGVSRDAVSGVLVFGTQRPVLYFPTRAEAEGTKLLLRVRGGAEPVMRAIDADLDRTFPGSLESIHTMDELVVGSLYGFKAAYWISSAIGAIALLLTLTGIYGVLSYLVTQRSREYGIRLALGASAGGVMRLILMQSMRLGLIGLAAGSVLALAASRVMAASISFIRMYDAVAYLGASAIVMAACFTAAFVPSRRAARIDPVVMLRED